MTEVDSVQHNVDIVVGELSEAIRVAEAAGCNPDEFWDLQCALNNYMIRRAVDQALSGQVPVDIDDDY